MFTTPARSPPSRRHTTIPTALTWSNRARYSLNSATDTGRLTQGRCNPVLMQASSTNRASSSALTRRTTTRSPAFNVALTGGASLGAGTDLPQPDHVVDMAGGEGPAVGAEGDRVDRHDTDLVGLGPVGGQIPQPRRAVAVAGGQVLAVRAVGERLDPVGGVVEGADHAPGRHAPQPHLVVAPAGRHGPAVRAERHREGAVVVAAEVRDLTRGRHAPQRHRVIVAADRQDLAVRAEGDRLGAVAEVL